ncbi:ribosomal protection-like ABC-F family protein [Schaedlerella sp.]|jgi:ATP-binding cassette subfamily F protein 3|uniref:ribosomal protection-like ABC-F family protein n=1 Tax=Schaedlerella sp. TaxID=2676057 RepID=UPI00374540DE|nr:ABC-F family ATP-binding cassette domain-containing protein [Ruminococcus sp.]
MILACHNLNKSFGERVIVRDGSFHIEEREKAAFVGVNGAGKSTVLKMIIGEEPLDGGNVILTRGKQLGYLAQQQNLESGNTVYEELKTAKSDIILLEQQIRSIEQELKSLSGEALEARLETYNRLMSEFESKNGYAYESEIVGVLKGLGFQEEEFEKPADTLSGGQKTRVSLGKLLLTNPDILLLDEPTNHLDLNSISWLETYLLNYPGAVFIVSHDRFFLNRVVTKVVEIEHGSIRMYSGNYKAYSDKKRQIRDAQMKEYLNQQREISRQEAVIEKLRSFNREKSIKRAESREKMLNKMTVVEKPLSDVQEIHFSLEPSCVSGNDVLSVEELSKQYDGQTLFSSASFEIKRGEHVAVIGGNGTGKTTLLKILNGLADADSGSFSLGTKVHIGYYDQEHHVLHDRKNIFDEISDDYPSLNNTEIRNTLAAFQFTGDDVFKLVGDLSGGEKGRVSLAKLMLSEANFLILDEPTNHLDITSKEILEQALNDYTGTVLYVSHDRYFINQTASRILELSDQTFVNYIGNYDYYLEKKEERTAALSTAGPQEVKGTSKGTYFQAERPAAGPLAAETGAASVNKQNWLEQKEAQARERKRKNELKRTEETISMLEARNQEINELMIHEDVYSNSVKCQELAEEKTANDAKLEELYELWAELEEPNTP